MIWWWDVDDANVMIRWWYYYDNAMKKWSNVDDDTILSTHSDSTHTHGGWWQSPLPIWGWSLTWSTSEKLIILSIICANQMIGKRWYVYISLPPSKEGSSSHLYQWLQVRELFSEIFCWPWVVVGVLLIQPTSIVHIIHASHNTLASTRFGDLTVFVINA